MLAYWCLLSMLKLPETLLVLNSRPRRMKHTALYYCSDIGGGFEIIVPQLALVALRAHADIPWHLYKKGT